MAAVASLVVLVFLTLSAGILHIPVVRDFALERGQGYLLDQRHIDLKSSKLDYNLFRGSSTLHDVVLRAPDAPDGSPPFFTADRVEVNLALTRLVTGSFEVQQARVVGGRIQVVYDAEGRSNVPRFTGDEAESEAAETAPALNFLIGDFRATGPLIRYVDQAAGREVEIADWAFDISGQRAPRSHRISFRTLRDGRLQEGELSLPLRVNEAELRFTPAKLDIDALALRVGASNLRLEGSATELKDPVWDLRTRGRIKLAEWAGYVGYQALTGDAEFSGTIRRRWERLLAEARVSATDLGFEDTQTRAEAVINWSREEGRLALPEITLVSSRGRFDGDAALFFDEARTSRARGSFERLDAAFFTRRFDAPYIVGARAAGAVSASWPGLDFGQATAEGRTTLRATAEEAREGFLPASGRVSFTRSAGGDLTAALSAFTALGASLTGQARVAASGTLGADIEAAMDDLGRTVREAQTLVGSAPDDAEARPLEGPASLRAAITGTLDEPLAQVSIPIGKSASRTGRGYGARSRRGRAEIRRRLRVHRRALAGTDAAGERRARSRFRQPDARLQRHGRPLSGRGHGRGRWGGAGRRYGGSLARRRGARHDCAA